MRRWKKIWKVKMKNMKPSGLVVWNQRLQWKIIEYFIKIIFFFCMYKMFDMNAKTWNKAKVSVVNIYGNDNVNKTLFKLLCISDVKKRWGGKNLNDLIDKEIKGKYENKNMNDLTKQQITKYKIDSVRLIKSSKHSMYIYEDILIPIIMQSSLSDSKTIKVRTDLGFNQINLILKKRTISVRIINRYIQRKRYTNSIRCFMLQNWSLFLWV